jgi:hypothetical protein
LVFHKKFKQKVVKIVIITLTPGHLTHAIRFHQKTIWISCTVLRSFAKGAVYTKNITVNTYPNDEPAPLKLPLKIWLKLKNAQIYKLA